LKTSTQVIKNPTLSGLKVRYLMDY